MRRVSRIFSKKGKDKSKSKKSFKEEEISENDNVPQSRQIEAAAEPNLPSPPISSTTQPIEMPPAELNEGIDVSDGYDDEEEKEVEEMKKLDVESADVQSGPPMIACPEGGTASFVTAPQLELIMKMRLLIPTLYSEPVPPFVELCGDLRMLRFLEGYGCDVGAASQAYVGMLEWRKRNDMDSVRQRIADNWDDDLHRYNDFDFPNKTIVLKHLPLELNYSYSVPESGRAGHLVTLEKTGMGEPLALIDELSLDEYINFEKQNMEHKAILLDRRSRELGYLVKIIAIRDMAGLGMKHCGARGVNMMTSVLKMMQGAYPEVIENIFMINAPWIFSTLWALVKPFVAPRTIEKIKIFSAGDMKNAQSLLRARIGAEQLPVRYGGKRPDVEPRQPVNPQKSRKAPASTTSAVVASQSTSSSKTMATHPTSAKAPTTLPTTKTSTKGPTNMKTSQLKTAIKKADKACKQEVVIPTKAKIDDVQAEEEERTIDHDESDTLLVDQLPDEVVTDIPVQVKQGGFKTAPSTEGRSDIPAKAHLMVELDVDMDSNQKDDKRVVVVSWGFKLITFLATMDIGFSVSFKSKDSDEVEVVRKFSRVPEGSPHCAGSWSTRKPGTISFTWDNSYSMFLTKEIEYKINVWEAKGDEEYNNNNDGGGGRTRSMSFTSVLSNSDGIQLSQFMDPSTNNATLTSNHIHSDDTGSGGSTGGTGDRKSDNEVVGDDMPIRSGFGGFDLSMSDNYLSEYLSFSSSPLKKEDEEEPVQTNNKTQDNLKEDDKKEKKEKDKEEGAEELSFWDKLMSSNKTKAKT